MTDDKLLVSHAQDLKNRALENSMITNTLFLDLRQRSLLSAIEKQQSSGVNTYYYGGYAEAERVCAVFVPSFFETGENLSEYFSEYEDDNPLALLKVTKDRFSSLSHRDYLGALMALGIKREMLGDILVEETCAYIICIKSISKFITENLTSVGRGAVTSKAVPFFEISQRKENFLEIKDCIASARLDNVVSAAFSISRTKSAEFIEKGVVFVNSGEVTKPDSKVNEGDKIVLRGKGKAVFEKVDAVSKKGRLHITLKKYI